LASRTWVRLLKRERAPHVAASIPAANLTEVPTETHVALRASDAMATDSLTSETLTLTDPGGIDTTTMIPAEDGRLAFVWPSVPLADGATYDVTVSGVIGKASPHPVCSRT
jgi:hypothetical protein